MKILKKTVLYFLAALVILVVGYDIWGAATLGKITPAVPGEVDRDANRVVMVLGATGSVGDGLLKAALEDSEVDKVYVLTRRTSPRIDAGVASGKLEMLLHKDFTDYSGLDDILEQVNTVLWGLGTTSIGMDDATYTWIHVDFPVAFVKAWLSVRTQGPMSFHYITGMGTDPQGSSHWAREKGRAELEVAELASSTDLRTFGYRSAFVRPTTEQSGALHYLGEVLLKPGALVISARQLGTAMLEISARTSELPNGTLIDNKDSIEYARVYRERKQG